MARLGDYVRIRTGKLDANASSEKGQYPFFTCAIEPLRIDSYSYDCECVLVAGNGDLNVKYYNGKFDAYQRTYIIESLDKSVLTVPYLYCFLDKYVETLRQQSIGGVIKYIKLGNLTEADIPILPVEEQEEVVTKINKANNLISARKEQLAKLDQLVKSRFIELFGDVKKVDKLINLCNFIDYRGKTPEKTESGLPFITAKNVKMHHMSFDTQEFISKETYDKVMTRGFPRIGDVVFTTEAPLGNVCRIPYIETEFYIGQRIITMQTEQLEPAYLEYALSSDDFKRRIAEKSSGSTVTGIRSKLLEQLTIPVPPRAVQKQFTAFVEQTDKSKVAIQQSLDKLELLKKALMQEYFG